MSATVIGTDVTTGQACSLPYAERDLGLAIVGKSGTGKSSIFEHLILGDLIAGTPGMVIDPHGRNAREMRCFGLSRGLFAGGDVE